jgi:hypothetical protein
MIDTRINQCITSFSQGLCFERLGKVSDLQDIISNIQKAVNFTDDGHPMKPMHLADLGFNQRLLFKHPSNLTDLEDAISNLARVEPVEFVADAHPGPPYLTESALNSLVICLILKIPFRITKRQLSSRKTDIQKKQVASRTLELDAGNFSNSVGEHNIGDNQLSTEDVGKERRRIIGEWEKLVERIRQLPNYQWFSEAYSIWPTASGMHRSSSSMPAYMGWMH